jgi:hypothetical protein
MKILNFYRFFLSISGGAVIFFTFIHSWWVWLCSSVLFRITWALIEGKYNNLKINEHFNQHSYDFKQLLGPYGIRMINKAESEPLLKKSLCEVFTPNLTKLQETVKNLEMMDSLFKAGLHPDADTYQLHDLKLKYGKYRLQKNSISN